MYSAAEYTDMIICYGMADESANLAARIYAERFPNRERFPLPKTIRKCILRAKKTGSLQKDKRNCGRAPAHRVDHEEEVLRMFEENPGTSVRRAARALNLPRCMVHRTLRQNNLRPFHYQRVQQLLERDEAPRVQFCEGICILFFSFDNHNAFLQRLNTIEICTGFLAQCRRNASFPDCILWTDEATFTPNGVFNSRNHLLWQFENPHAIREGAFQYRWSINVWAGVLKDRVIGPHFLPPRLNAQAYADFHNDDLPILLEDVPLHARQTLIYQHDGAPAHFSRQIREILDARFPERWI